MTPAQRSGAHAKDELLAYRDSLGVASVCQVLLGRSPKVSVVRPKKTALAVVLEPGAARVALPAGVHHAAHAHAIANLDYAPSLPDAQGRGRMLPREQQTSNPDPSTMNGKRSVMPRSCQNVAAAPWAGG